MNPAPSSARLLRCTPLPGGACNRPSARRPPAPAPGASEGKTDIATSGPRLTPLLKRLGVELGPLLVFFAAFKLADFMAATAIFMAAIAVVTAGSYAIERRLPVVPAFSTLVALVAGALTLALESEQFMKMRPTILNGVYGAAMLGSLLAGRAALRQVLGGSLHLSDRGWRGLTWRTAVFLFVLAAANEAVWRSFPTDTWVAFKVFGIVPLDAAFGLAMWPYVKRHWDPEAAAADGAA